MPKSRHDFRSSEIRILIDDAQAGDSTSIGALLQIYRNYLSVLAAAQFKQNLKARVSPSDVVQETLLRAHHRFATFRGVTEPELVAWLWAILVNSLAKFVEQHVLAERRDLRREVSLEKTGNSLENSAVGIVNLIPANGKSPSMAFQRQEEAVELADRLAKLPADYRAVLVLRNLQELPFDEIARPMDRSVKATRMLWLRAIEKLRQLYRIEKQQGE